MVKYDSLQAKFESWNTLCNHYKGDATTEMVKFLAGFRSHLVASKADVKLCKIDNGILGPNKYVAEETGSVLSQTQDGAWQFAIEIIFRMQSELVKKEVDDIRFFVSCCGDIHVFMDIRLELLQDGVLLKNANDSRSPLIECKFNKTNNYVELYNHLTTLLDNWFDEKPWNEKTSIGFKTTNAYCLS